MQSRTERHRKILELIESKSIDTQESLKKALLKSGFEVNQATLSRDMRELGLVKIESSGQFRYVTGKNMPAKSINSVGFTAIAKFIKDIEHSGNIIVVKTDNGAASYVAEAIDNLQLHEVLGTVAGDNTLILILRAGCPADTVIQKMRSPMLSRL